MKLLLVLSVYVCVAAQTRDVHQVMQRVAANQAKPQDLRKSFVYRQKQHWRFNHGDGRLAREEWRDYVITPEVRSAKKDLQSLSRLRERLLDRARRCGGRRNSHHCH